MKLKKLLHEILNESPDNITVNGNRIYYTDVGNIPFAEYSGKVYLGRGGDGHAGLARDIEEELDMPRWSIDSYGGAGAGNLTHHGRLFSFKKHKIISFWSMPSKSVIKKIIKGVESKSSIKIFNNGWRIEVNPISSNDEDRYENIDTYLGTSKQAKFNLSSQFRKHMESPLEKRRSPEEQEFLNFYTKNRDKKFGTLKQKYTTRKGRGD